MNFEIIFQKHKILDKLKELEIPQSEFLKFHQAPWNASIKVSENFTLTKKQTLFENVAFYEAFDLIYYDAFGIRVQPELWTTSLMEKMYHALKPGGIFVTYASNGETRRNLQKVNFEVEKIKGPPGKKEMIRAFKPNS